MNETISLMARAKAAIDNGLSRLGKDIDFSNPVDSILVVFASRSVASSNAIALLISHGHEIEALSVLRTLAILSLWSRWVMEKDSAVRAEEALSEISKLDWEAPWRENLWSARAAHLDFESSLRQIFIEIQSLKFYSKTGSVPWDHGVEKYFLAAPQAPVILETAGLFMTHLVEALDVQWPGYFTELKEITKRQRREKS
jgi:hypothetical protein